jgi:hypothetical protein
MGALSFLTFIMGAAFALLGGAAIASSSNALNQIFGSVMLGSGGIIVALSFLIYAVANPRRRLETKSSGYPPIKAPGETRGW